MAFNVIGPLAAGGIVLMDKWDAEASLRLIEQYRISHTHMVATMFHRLCQKRRDLAMTWATCAMCSALLRHRCM